MTDVPLYNRWDIWFANVQYEDEPQTAKERPVLVTGSKTYVTVFALKMTTHEPRDEFDYRVRFWMEAGLNEASVIRISKQLALSPADMRYRVGRLQPHDIRKVAEKLSLLSNQTP